MKRVFHFLFLDVIFLLKCLLLTCFQETVEAVDGVKHVFGQDMVEAVPSQGKLIRPICVVDKLNQVMVGVALVQPSKMHFAAAIWEIGEQQFCVDVLRNVFHVKAVLLEDCGITAQFHVE